MIWFENYSIQISSVYRVHDDIFLNENKSNQELCGKKTISTLYGYMGFRRESDRQSECAPLRKI